MTRSRRMPPSAFLRLLRRHTSGPFRLEGVTVTGDLDLSGQSFGFDLELPGCRIEGALILDGVTGQSIDLTGLHAEAVQAFRLRLSTDLTLRQAVIGSGNGTEPLADQRVTGSGDEVAGPFGVPRHKAVSSAVLELSDARIDGDLMLADLTLGSSGQWSLYADQLQVTGSVTGTGLSATGAVHLRAANIGGAVYLNGARIAGMEASVAQIRRGLYVDWGFTSTGQVRLRSSEVGVLVTFHDAVITGGLNLARLRTPRLRLDFRDRPEGRIVLRDAQVDAYVDNRESWPEPGRLDLEGLTYRRLAEGPARTIRSACAGSGSTSTRERARTSSSRSATPVPVTSAPPAWYGWPGSVASAGATGCPPGCGACCRTCCSATATCRDGPWPGCCSWSRPAPCGSRPIRPAG
ncbi:hypothetical protein ACFQ0B_20670 [Nonomuraea thailandensis]